MRTSNIITIGANTNSPLTIRRFGYGTMQLTGDYVWGEPKNRPEALQILKAAVGNGIYFLDTADFYGNDVTNRLIAEALYPYPDNLVICTKVGTKRGADKSWKNFSKPDHIKTSIERNIKTLKVEQLQLVHFRITPGAGVPLQDSLNALFELQKEGKILHIGLSNANKEELLTGMAMGNIVSVENAYGHGQRKTYRFHGSEIRGMQEVMSICTKNQIAMIPFWSLQNSLAKADDRISIVAKKHHATPAQINIAWLLHDSNLILPIPGTSKLRHFEENIKASDIILTEDDMKFLE